MKQRSGFVSSMLTPNESEVAEILIKFRTFMSESEKKRGFPFTWGRKNKRSAINVNVNVTPSQSPPHLKGEASSPATPLSFSPSESDDNPSLFRRNVSVKRKREHYLKIIEELTKDNDLLYGEIKNVRSYFDRLKDFNLKLKARKQELSLGSNQEDLIHNHKQLKLQFPGMAQHLPLIMNHQTAVLIDCGVDVAEASGSGQATTSLPSSSSNGLGMANTDMGPIGIPDLNVPFEESMAVDSCEGLDVNVDLANKNLSRAMAAQARQNRLQICRVKNPIGNTKTRFFCR